MIKYLSTLFLCALLITSCKDITCINCKDTPQFSAEDLKWTKLSLHTARYQLHHMDTLQNWRTDTVMGTYFYREWAENDICDDCKSLDKYISTVELKIDTNDIQLNKSVRVSRFNHEFEIIIDNYTLPHSYSYKVDTAKVNGIEYTDVYKMTATNSLYRAYYVKGLGFILMQGWEGDIAILIR